MEEINKQNKTIKLKRSLKDIIKKVKNEENEEMKESDKIDITQSTPSTIMLIKNNIQNEEIIQEKSTPSTIISNKTIKLKRSLKDIIKKVKNEENEEMKESDKIEFIPSTMTDIIQNKEKSTPNTIISNKTIKLKRSLKDIIKKVKNEENEEIEEMKESDKIESTSSTMMDIINRLKDENQYIELDIKELNNKEDDKSRLNKFLSITKTNDFFESTYPIQEKETCITRSKVPLQPHQLQVVEYMKNNDSLLVLHSTGCGKTLTAITVSQCYLDRYPNNKVIFIGPAGLIKNFHKEMTKYGIDSHDNRYNFYSFDKFHRDIENLNIQNNCIDSLIIIDEVHNLRNAIGRRTSSVYKCILKSHKTLLLTATAFINNMNDFIPIINMLYKKIIVGTHKQYGEGIVNDYLTKELTSKTLNKLYVYLKNKIHYNDCKNEEDFPSVIKKFINIKMSEEYYNRYLREIGPETSIFYDPKRFYNGHRRAVNKLSENYYGTKLEAMLPILQEGHTLVYTNWLSFGVEPITNMLKKNNITYAIYTGEIDKEEKADLLINFNKKKFQVLVITRAGAEGIDLKEVRNVLVTEPVWNNAGLIQILGRAVRYKSHENLPLEERKVTIYYLVSSDTFIESDDELVKYIFGYKNEPRPKSGDVILYTIIMKKYETEEKLKKLYKQVSL
jgi:superfamily II DNA or RNA helicase